MLTNYVMTALVIQTMLIYVEFDLYRLLLIPQIVQISWYSYLFSYFFYKLCVHTPLKWNVQVKLLIFTHFHCFIQILVFWRTVFSSFLDHNSKTPISVETLFCTILVIRLALYLLLFYFWKSLMLYESASAHWLYFDVGQATANFTFVVFDGRTTWTPYVFFTCLAIFLFFFIALT